ncbi:spermatogenesis-associated protein 6 isoform X1 [Pogonomyrmex barbatus]|uniref:Spermatogenesis-associated protein 6 isoform X1 n=1 Tax=Pogonomyrmex barbatus TaxID=144034 RepID=A0A6I9XNG1_9HYME|nr:spermatogenesis-associated protein 6 isoform X1 [Pogonomyrmex barbatus]XP_011647617.1 spermatogenesis-associated protein 6 isoform X1 [Pogonomyrmex barbatus]
MYTRYVSRSFVSYSRNCIRTWLVQRVRSNAVQVTCPGVWLCSNGKVALQINALDSYAESRRISPIFPLLFHDKFTFSKIFTRVISLAELQCTLEQEFLYAKLIQWVTPASRGIILATFETNLADLLYPAPCFKGLLAGVDIDLLMESTKCFPGIIAPKIEISTKTIVEEVLGSYDKYVINPKMINSKQTACAQRKRPIKGIIRQRRVCHTKTKPRSQSCRPYRQRSNDCQCSAMRYATSHQTGSQIDQCYHSIKKDSACTCQANFTKSAEPTLIRNNIHVIDNCPVCFKYNCYFPKYHDDSDIAKKYIDAKQRCHRNLSDVGECDYICRNGASDIQKEAATSL